MSEQPLHVRVAEALGCKVSKHAILGWSCGCKTKRDEPSWPHGETSCGQDGEERYPDVRRYDTDWAATGPLIERYAVHVEPDACHPPQWLAFVLHAGEEFTVSEGPGKTPLEAVCALILALKEAGKL